jgi:hypothetical protein
VSVLLSSRPINVLSAAGLSPTSISPNGDGSNDVTTMSWLAGDRAKYTFQVFKGGALVRNVTVGAMADAGLRSAVWDGRISGAPAAPGIYSLRIANIGPDGRVSYLLKSVTVL